jgi:hypothetical protein
MDQYEYVPTLAFYEDDMVPLFLDYLYCLCRIRSAANFKDFAVCTV